MSDIVDQPRKPSALTGLQARGATRVVTTVDERADRLDRTKLSARMAWGQERAVANFLCLYRLPAGTELFREGDHDSFCGILIQGALDITKRDVDERVRVMARVKPGKMVGEMSLIDGAARSASAIAVEPSEILLLSGEEFDRMCEKAPRLALKFTLMIAEATANLLRQTTGTLVDHLGT